MIRGLHGGDNDCEKITAFLVEFLSLLCEHGHTFSIFNGIFFLDRPELIKTQFKHFYAILECSRVQIFAHLKLVKLVIDERLYTIPKFNLKFIFCELFESFLGLDLTVVSR